MLRIEPLEARDVPSTFKTVADLRPYYAGDWTHPLSHLPDDRVAVLSIDQDLADPVNRIHSLYVAVGAGLPAHAAVADGMTGEPVGSVFGFDPSMLVGVRDVAAIGPKVYLSTLEGGGPVVSEWDTLTGVVRQFFAFEDANFRGGVQIREADTDRDGDLELVAIPGGTPETAGSLRVVVLDGATGGIVSDFIPPGYEDDRRVWRFVPAATGVSFFGAVPGYGMLLEPADAVPDETGHVAETIRVYFDGRAAPGGDPFDSPSPTEV